MTLSTEEKAKQRWCPLARYSQESRPWKRAINRWIGKSDMTLNPEPARCIASDCQAWRWRVGPPQETERADYHETTEQRKWRGYCGAFGKP